MKFQDPSMRSSKVTGVYTEPFFRVMDFSNFNTCIIRATAQENLFMLCANNKGADQSAAWSAPLLFAA